MSCFAPALTAYPHTERRPPWTWMETMYVNLDYYGRVDKINVVKGVGLNGRTEFTDYGTYENVINMSNSIEPVLGDGTVTWQLPQAQRERFYYKCAVDKDRMVLPWDFDVSYKLNGVPTDADKLAGASGLIEINVKAEPNDNAGAYYRNNMMLMVAVPVDMSKCYSVEAEGSPDPEPGGYYGSGIYRPSGGGWSLYSAHRHGQL